MLLPSGMYPRACNIVNRGGILQTRPGYQCKFVLPAGTFQGAEFFRPRSGATVLLFAVSGLLYLSEAPFTEYRQLSGVEFSPIAAQVFFAGVEDSITQNEDGSLKFRDAQSLMVMQDGGTARPVVFDGTTARHVTGIPLGGPMVWVADRLWVSQGTKLIPSDLADPQSFTEAATVINSPKFFLLPAPIVALSKLPSTQLAQLVVFTETSTTLFQVGITDRSQWTSVPDFQKVIFERIGCVANRSVTSLHGKLWWYAAQGLTTMDAAIQANISTAMPYVDSEMTESKSRLSEDLSTIAGCAFENYLLMSVPNSDLLNQDTWALDMTPLQTSTAPAWNSVWRGTRPMQWVYGVVNGENRCFQISADFDGNVRLWDSFTPDRRDSGCPISWWFETRALTFASPGKFKEFRYADIFMAELSGRVDIAAFWAGGHRGKYKRILTKKILASRGTFRSGETVDADDKIFALKKQSRHVWTQDGRELNSKETLPSCGAESPNKDFIDEAFQVLVVGSGAAALRGFIAYAEPPVNVDDAGRPEKNEDEENFVRFDGAAAEGHDFQEALVQFDENIPSFSSTRTEYVTQGGLTEVATATAHSLISQDSADYVASRTAIRKASFALEKALPSIYSVGELANEADV